MKAISRTSSAINNTIVGIVASIVTVLLNIFVRVIVVDYLGDQINGLNSLFLSIISVLALVQTGFSTAMIIHLYRPVHEKNELLISQLLGYYKKLYLRVAYIFLSLGIIVDIFLMDYLVTSTINMWYVRGYFLIFVFAYFINFSTYYKRSLLYAEQKNRVCTLITMISELIFRGLTILLVIVFKQYILFLLMLLCEFAFSNLACAHYVNKHHPFLKYYKNKYLPQHAQKDLSKTIKPLMVNQISDTVQKSSQSIIISLLLGNVAIVGYYGSYQLVGSTIQLLMSHLGGAFTSGFGNLSAENNEHHMSIIFNKFFLIVGFISILLCTVALCCIQDVINFLFGVNFVLPFSAVVLIFVTVFFTIIGMPVISVQNSMGLHKLDSKYMVIQALFAIVLSYVGGKFIGMNGILLGSIIPIFIFTIIGKGYIITHHVYKNHGVHYLKQLMLLLLRSVIVAIPTIWLCGFVHYDALIINAVAKGVIGFVVALIILSTTYIPNHYYREYLKTFFKIIAIRLIR